MLFLHWTLITSGSSTFYTRSLQVLETQLLTCNLHPVSLNHSAETLDPARATYVCPNLLCMIWALLSPFDRWFCTEGLGGLFLAGGPSSLSEHHRWRSSLLPLVHHRCPFFLPVVLAYFLMLNTGLQSHSESTTEKLLWRFTGVTDTRIRLSMWPLE